MKQILLATALIALPVAGFSLFQIYVAAPAAVAATTPVAADPLGDLSAMKKIISDVETISATGVIRALTCRGCAYSSAAKYDVETMFENVWED